MNPFSLSGEGGRRTNDVASAHLPALTSLRFMAALWVVLFHYGMAFLTLTPDFARDLRKVGYVGVSFFFLLSGFVLAYNYLPRVEAGTFHAREFWLARLARVYPLYVSVLAATIPAAFLAQPAEALVRLLMLQAWWPDWVGGWNLPAWSLSTEAFFYLAFPALIVAVVRIPARRLPLALAGTAALALATPAAYVLLRPASVRTAVDSFTFATTVVKMDPLVRLPEFAAGVLLGAAYLRLDLRERLLARPWARRAVFLSGLALVALLVESRRHVPWELMHDGLFLLPFGLVLVALAPGAGTASSLLSYRAPVFLGEASYAVYLLHAPLHDWIGARFFPDYYHRDDRAFFFVYLASLVALATMLHLFIERPARRWLRSPREALRTARARLAILLALSPLGAFAQTPIPPVSEPKGTDPTVVVFLAKGCPCNARCMGELNRLSRLLGPRTPFVGLVVGGRAADLPAYRAGLGCAFPLRFDPRGATAARDGAVCSLDLALLDGKGRRIRLWEGIGRETVADLGEEMVRRFGAKSRPDPSGFSEIVQTGCRLGVCYPLRAAARTRAG